MDFYRSEGRKWVALVLRTYEALSVLKNKCVGDAVVSVGVRSNVARLATESPICVAISVVDDSDYYEILQYEELAHAACDEQRLDAAVLLFPVVRAKSRSFYDAVVRNVPVAYALWTFVRNAKNVEDVRRGIKRFESYSHSLLDLDKTVAKLARLYNEWKEPSITVAWVADAIARVKSTNLSALMSQTTSSEPELLLLLTMNEPAEKIAVRIDAGVRDPVGVWTGMKRKFGL